MSREHLQTAIEALEYQHAAYSKQLDREPRTRNGKPNPMRLHLMVCMNSINEARHNLIGEIK